MKRQLSPDELILTCRNALDPSNCCILTQMNLLSEGDELTIQLKMNLQNSSLDHLCTQAKEHLSFLLKNMNVLIIDLSRNQLIHSSGISFLLKMHQISLKNNIDFRITNVSSVVAENIRFKKLDRILKVG
ncbi:STAS domain-containing protein [Heliophilum fasciatum]|uniref:STAS domain-containing protein n=1 Tax=Heliophilum fasciatum TaxID=35700 RepID=A0A4R2RGP6_9FIRM|nr:STAS domain-containing protein [Heliophilum fasciatum]MCW2279493.1 anti-anti-sigma regulatory factor [Heliophilum fasciatum]TCP58801.1 STAS domain-containing protein [Heliophilum fasciatum]